MVGKTLEIMQLADACFPSGGFAFSNGLESLAKLGYIRRMEDFRQYLECHLEQVASAELPFLNSAFAAADFHLVGPAFEPHSPMERPSPSIPASGKGFAAIVREWDAWVFLPSQRRGSLAQGQAWSRAMEEAYDLPDLRAMRPWFLGENLPLHFLMVFASSLKAAGISLEDGQSLLMHMAMRDQLGAAVRLGMLGSLQAQKLHREFIQIGESLRLARGDWGHDRAVRAAPMIDLAQASHAYLYSKLFQS